MSFTGKVVIVTGSSSGIGAETAIQFSKEGAHVVISGRTESKLKEIAAKCNNPLVVRADLSKDEDIKNIIKQTVDKYGKIDVLVNNAALFTIGSLRDGKIVEAYDDNFAVNVRAPMYLTSLATPYLIESKGNVVNVSSVGGQSPTFVPEIVTYCASKAALNHFNTCAAKELASHGIRVNAVSPGPVRTDAIENSPYFETAINETALKRASETIEIADLILYLASDKAKGITGSNFVTDNGALL